MIAAGRQGNAMGVAVCGRGCNEWLKVCSMAQNSRIGKPLVIRRYRPRVAVIGIVQTQSRVRT